MKIEKLREGTKIKIIGNPLSNNTKIGRIVTLTKSLTYHKEDSIFDCEGQLWVLDPNSAIEYPICIGRVGMNKELEYLESLIKVLKY